MQAEICSPHVKADYELKYSFVVYLINTPTNAHTYSFNDLKFTLKHLKRSTCFDHTIILREHTLFLAKVIV